MKIIIITLISTLLLSLSIYGQAKPMEPEIETFYLESDGEIAYRYVLDKKICNCFFQIEHKKSKSISITQVSCEKLNRFYTFKESYSKCLN
jgi:hypothetical protein